MARFCYFRVSTETQSHERQMFRMTEYFNRMGMSMDEVEIVSEKITSYTSFKEREIYQLLQKAEEGDVIFVCQLDRLGRTTSDILELVDFALGKGINITTINDGQTISNKGTGKLYLTILAAMAEMEREIRAERCQAGVDAAMDKLRKKGSRKTRRGTTQTRWGNEKGTEETKRIMRIAREHSSLASQEALIKWRESSEAYQWAMLQIRKGKTRKTIVEEFNELHAKQPEVFCTRNGKPLSEAVLSKWVSMANPLTL